jgi:hypothetical protein
VRLAGIGGFTIMIGSKSKMATAFLSRVHRGLNARKRALKKIASQIRRDEFCGAYINWRWPPKQWEPMAWVHWCYSRSLWRESRLRAIATTLIWPGLSLIFAWKQTQKHGTNVKTNTGLSLTRQFVDQICLANLRYVPPRAYYLYEFYRTENRRQAQQYIQDHEITALLEMANGDIDYNLFNDKLQFYLKCKQFALATIPILARFEKGEIKFIEDHRLPEEDLFAKPELGKCGQGALMYYYAGSATYRSTSGRVMGDDDILEQIADCSKETPYILQPRYKNHPEIARLSPQALCTSRVITCRAPSGSVEVLACIFKMATGNNCTDNFATGGIAIPVDIQTGTLGRGVTKEQFTKRIKRHPQTGQIFAGFQIPGWRDLISLCIKAHNAFGAYALIGWDVAITGDGPILVEGNLRWGVESMQIAHGGPLGGGGFASRYLAHVHAGPILNSIPAES